MTPSKYRYIRGNYYDARRLAAGENRENATELLATASGNGELQRQAKEEGAGGY